MLVGDVWLNGEHVGKTDYGYVGFEIDITKKIKAGQQHIHLHQGTALAILRSSSLPGRVTITATAQKLKASASWTTQQ